MPRKPAGRSSTRGPSGRSYRNDTGLTRQPKKMRGRKPSSQRWLTRQLNDPFVAQAKSRGFRSRAALKLEQIDERYEILQSGMAIVDLGCAPGGWLQVAADRIRLGSGNGKLVGIDLLETDVLEGVEIFVGDMTDPVMIDRVRAAVGGRANGVMSDWRQRQQATDRPTIFARRRCSRRRWILPSRCWSRTGSSSPNVSAAVPREACWS